MTTAGDFLVAVCFMLFRSRLHAGLARCVNIGSFYIVRGIVPHKRVHVSISRECCEQDTIPHQLCPMCSESFQTSHRICTSATRIACSCVAKLHGVRGQQSQWSNVLGWQSY